jgi:ubiquinone/menaquinone biosynthesis C-methylase UbiE
MTPFPLRKALQDLINKKESFSLIDVGCGKGDVLYLLKKSGHLKGAKIIGLDIDKKAIQAFKKKMPGAKAILSDALSLKGLKNGSFDFVICTQVIEHLEDDKALVSQINRLLRRGGRLYITSVLKKWYGLYWHRNKFGQIVLDPNHVREYISSEEFTSLLTKKGLSIKDLNIHPGILPLVDYFLLLLGKVGILRLTSIRDYYLNHPRIYQLSKKLVLPLPGYATIEVVAEKK